MELTSLSDLEPLRAALRSGATASASVVSAALARAEASQRRLVAFAELDGERALVAARAADADLQAGRDRGPWHGLPIAVKDVIDVAGLATRNGTPGAGHRLAESDAPVVAALREAGALTVGKATTHELAFGMVTPVARNPFDVERIAGGSSGGSAVAVAAGLVAGALGTDTNGSVRCPASLCGVAGLRPTHGRLSAAGVSPLAWSQDTVGVIAASVKDCADLFAALGPAERPTAAPRTSLRVGTDRAQWIEASEPAIAEACGQALRELAGDRIEIVEVAMPSLQIAGAASFVTIMAEAAAAWSAELARNSSGFGAGVRASLQAGAEVRAADYLQSRRVCALLRAQLRELFRAHDLDALALPTLPVTAARAGQHRVALRGRDVAVESAHTRFLALASAAGLPALSVPCGLDPGGLPIGLQLIGAPWGEATIFELGAAVEAHDGARAVAARRRMLTEPRERIHP